MTRKTGLKRRIGRPTKHGADALIYRDEIIKQYPELVSYTRDCRDGLERDLAPEGADSLPMAKQIILDRLTAKLQTAGLLDIYLGKHGILRLDRLDQRVLETEPAVQVWLQVNHAILRDLLALGLERRELGPRVLSPLEIAAEIDAEKAAQGDGKASCSGNRAGEGEIAPQSASQGDIQDNPGERSEE